MLTPNPERHRVRELLANVRRAHWEMWNYAKKYPKKASPQRMKQLRKLERSLSRQLRHIAPFIDSDKTATRESKEVWVTGSFSRFRHSTRFRHWKKEAGKWVRKS